MMRIFFALVVGCGALGLGGCGALDVSDPTVIDGENLDNATGAGYLWNVARFRFAEATDRAALHGAMWTDEMFFDADPASTDPLALLDRRDSEQYQASQGTYGDQTAYYAWQTLRRDATIAIPRAKSYGPPAHVGELFALRGYAALRLAEDICPGFPLRDVVDLQAVYGPPLTNDEAFASAVVEFDSALAYADSARVINFARVGKARALLGLGRFADAAAVAADVPDGYAESAAPSSSSFYIWADHPKSVANREGGNGLDYVAAADPRVGLIPGAKAEWHDTSYVKQAIAKYPLDLNAPIVVADDIEARLIQAEAQLQPAASPAGPWLATLNALRARVGLTDTTDPGTADARVDLLFRERAFWLFATGHRLGDLRRLIARYGRDAESVFPAGAPWSGPAYGGGTSLPFTPDIEKLFNPAITGCTSR